MKILIDNGHGIDTPGKKSPWCLNKIAPELVFEEWRYSRIIATGLVEMLKSFGYDAELLVTEDNDVSLPVRCKRINKFCQELGKDNVILISIHSNACGNGNEWNSARGWSAYTTKGTTKSDKLAECLYRAAERYFKGIPIRKDTSDGDSDYEEQFYILKNSNCLTVLTENFFYTNVEDTKYLLSEEGQQAIIDCHFDGIVKYIQDQK